MAKPSLRNLLTGIKQKFSHLTGHAKVIVVAIALVSLAGVVTYIYTQRTSSKNQDKTTTQTQNEAPEIKASPLFNSQPSSGTQTSQTATDTPRPSQTDPHTPTGTPTSLPPKVEPKQ